MPPLPTPSKVLMALAVLAVLGAIVAVVLAA